MNKDQRLYLLSFIPVILTSNKLKHYDKSKGFTYFVHHSNYGRKVNGYHLIEILRNTDNGNIISTNHPYHVQCVKKKTE